MKNIRLVLGFTALGIALAVGCGDDPKSATSTGEGGESNSGAGKTGKGGTPSTGGTNSNTSGEPGSDGGTSTTPTDGGVGQSGGGPIGPGCGNGPACDEDTQECVGGECLLVDGEACTANTDCVHTCINEECGPRAEVLGDCDYEGTGGAGGAGSGSAGAPGGGAGGEGGGDGIYVPPEEIGNGDDLDCLDGLACDSGSCKRKQMTDCTGPEQCLSGLCHKSKCTLQEPGVCQAAACADADANTGMCGAGTTAVNQCSFNYLPNSTCSIIIKGPTCYGYCTCSLAP